jgi:hypothetical protein
MGVVVLTFLLLPHATYGWGAIGHETVAGIAWDSLSVNERQAIVNLLMQAPADSCLRELFPSNGSLAARQRRFFIMVATWPDIVRPRNDADHRVCTKYHEREWHFVDHFWAGTSGDPTDPPHDLNVPIAQINAAERIRLFRNLAVDSHQPPRKRAMALAWILHLVGDIHQPLHTSGRVTSAPNEQDGDAGGNDFLIGTGPHPRTLHSYWDNIIALERIQNEADNQFVDRLTGVLEHDFPLTSFTALHPGAVESWVLESLRQAKTNAYPRTLIRGQMPDTVYQANTLRISRVAIAESGYRLGNLLSQMF